MASEKLAAMRAVPRGVAEEFRQNRYLGLMCIGAALCAGMALLSAGSSVMGGQSETMWLEAIFEVFSAFALGYFTWRFFALRESVSGPKAGKARKSCIIVFAVMMITVVFLGIFYWVLYSTLRGADPEELLENMSREYIDSLWALLPITITGFVIQVCQAIAQVFLFRAMGDMELMAEGRYPKRNSFTAASNAAALAAGMSICGVIMNLMTGFGLVNLIAALPEVLLYLSMCLLCRATSEKAVFA